MKVRLHFTIMCFLVMVLISSVPAAGKGLLEELGLPAIPGAKVTGERDLAAGALQSLENEYGAQLGISSWKRLRQTTLGIDSLTEARDILANYETALQGQGWKSQAKTVDTDGATARFASDGTAILLIDVDPASKKRDREVTFTWVLGKVGPASALGKPPKIDVGSVPASNSGGDLDSPQIPSGKPISVPPAQWLKLESTNSDVKVRLVSGNTAEIHPSSSRDNPGKLVRTDDGLILVLTPKLQLDESTLPGTTPLTLEATGGSLAITADLSLVDQPAALNINAKAASVSLSSFPLLSEIHRLNVVGGKVQIVSSRVQGGRMDVNCTGGDVVLGLPKDASATISIQAPAGTIQNLTRVDPQSVTADKMVLRMGDGKAQIGVKAINGTVRIELNP